MERIREIIIDVVETESQYDDGLVKFADSMQDGDRYQLYLMEGAGLIEGRSCKEGFFFITNEGHDFYDALKSEGIWEQTKAAVAETGGSATLDVMTQLAKGFLKSKIEKHTGLDL